MSTPRGVGVPEWFETFRAAPKGDGLTPTVVAVGLSLATFARWDTGDGARPAQSTLAAAVGVKRDAAHRALATLERAGWVASESRGEGRPKGYRLTIPTRGVLLEPQEHRPGS